ENYPPLKSGNEIIGHTIKLKAVKNKCGVPFRECFVNLIYGQGFDKEASLIEYADKRGLFQKNGSWYQMDLGNKDKKGNPVGPENIANGLANLKAALKDKPELLERVKNGVATVLSHDADVDKQ